MARHSSARFLPALALLAFGVPTVCSAPRKSGSVAEAPVPPAPTAAPAAAVYEAPAAPTEASVTAGPAAASDAATTTAPTAGLFQTTVQPILASRCAPCHVPGGKMYARLPFDDPAVVASHSGGISRRLKGDDLRALQRWLETQPGGVPK